MHLSHAATVRERYRRHWLAAVTPICRHSLRTRLARVTRAHQARGWRMWRQAWPFLAADEQRHVLTAGRQTGSVCMQQPDTDGNLPASPGSPPRIASFCGFQRRIPARPLISPRFVVPQPGPEPPGTASAHLCLGLRRHYVVPSGPGGDVPAALEITDTIWRRGYNTLIGNGAAELPLQAAFSFPLPAGTAYAETSPSLTLLQPSAARDRTSADGCVVSGRGRDPQCNRPGKGDRNHRSDLH